MVESDAPTKTMAMNIKFLPTGVQFALAICVCILVSCFYELIRIKGRGPQKEEKEGDDFDG